MPSLLTRSSLRHLSRHPWQGLLAILGVALGVAVVVAVDLAIASARRAFTLSTDAAVGRTTDWIVGGPAGVPEGVYTALRVDHGLTNIAPVVEGYGVAPPPGSRDARDARGAPAAPGAAADLHPGTALVASAAPAAPAAPVAPGESAKSVDSAAPTKPSTADSPGGPNGAAAAPAGGVLAGTGREAGSEVLHILGIDPLADAHFRPYLADRGGGIESASTAAQPRAAAGFPLIDLLTEPGAAVLAAPTARRLGLKAGDRFRLRVNGRWVEVRLAGLIEPQDERSREALDTLLVTDVATAQDWCGQAGFLSRIDAIVPSGAPGDSWRREVGGWLGPGLRLEPSSARGETLRQMTAAFDLNLTALSLLAMVCGMFLIYNSMTFSVVQRRPLIGTLRALGVTRGQIFTLVFREAAVVALAGSVLGVLLGLLLGLGLVRLVAQTINDLYFVVQVTHLALPAGTLVKGLGLGLAATAVAALPPAFEATRGPARAAMARSTIEAHWRRLTPRAALAGVALGAVGGLVMAVSGANLLLNFAALLGVILGCALVAPLLTVGLMALFGPLLGRLFGLFGRMAARGVTSTLSRTAVAIAALMIAVTVTVAIGVMVDSFRDAVQRWLEHTLIADIYVTTPKLTASRIEGTLDPVLADRLAALPGVLYITLYRGVDVASPAGPVYLSAIRMDPRSHRAFTFRAGAPATAWRSFDAGGVLATETFAYRRGLKPGDTVRLDTDRGPWDFPIAGVIQDYSSDRGGLIMSHATYLAHWHDAAVNSIGVYARPGVDRAALLAAARRVVPTGDEVLMQSNADLRAVSMQIFDRTFLITDVLRLVAMAVAFVGILSALMAQQLERSRELGVLRATGLTPGQLWRLIVTQTGLMGLAAGVLAAPAGVLLAALMIFVINRRSFGWSMAMHIEPGILIQALALALGAALLAGLAPAWRMSRTSPAAALREE
ncbi:MAG: FtsX-like permease family protein [Planctomycetota bacterium]